MAILFNLKERAPAFCIQKKRKKCSMALGKQIILMEKY